jgi:hypothetical protein
MGGQLRVPTALSPCKEHTAPTREKTGWASDPVWPLWSREESFAPAANRTPAVQSVARRYTD